MGLRVRIARVAGEYHGFNKIPARVHPAGHHRAQFTTEGNRPGTNKQNSLTLSNPADVVLLHHNLCTYCTYFLFLNVYVCGVLQDTNACVGPLAKLNSLNGAGRAKISQLRQFIDRFSNVAKDTKDAALLKELALYREQLAASMELFKRANIRAMLAIERNAKEELLRPRDPDAVLRQRQKRDKEELAKATSSVTDQLLSISRQLAETTRKSAATLDTLVVSSDGVVGAQEELKLTSDSITQSGKLLAKYGRREFTDKILMFFAFAFFVACVLYIVRKRLF